MKATEVVVVVVLVVAVVVGLDSAGGCGKR